MGNRKLIAWYDYGKDDKISEDDGDRLVLDIENFKSVIARSIKL